MTSRDCHPPGGTQSPSILEQDVDVDIPDESITQEDVCSFVWTGDLSALNSVGHRLQRAWTGALRDQIARRRVSEGARPG